MPGACREWFPPLNLVRVSASSFSGAWLTPDAPNLEIVTLPEAEDGEGCILFFRAIAGRSGEAALRFPVFRVPKAHRCNGGEENQQKLMVNHDAVTVPCKPNSFATVRLKTERPAQKAATK